MKISFAQAGIAFLIYFGVFMVLTHFGVIPDTTEAGALAIGAFLGGTLLLATKSGDF